jgi:glutathione S-transferase
MKLFYSPGASSLAPHIVLREAGLAFEPVLASIKTHQLGDGSDFHAINPLGYVPVLELDDGTRLREVAAIVQYVADRVPVRNLAPANGTLPRYRLQEWLSFVGTELHKSFGPLFNPGVPEEGRKVFRGKLAARLEWLDGQLASREFLLGEHFSVADAYLFAVGRWVKPPHAELGRYRHVAAHHQRVGERPAVQEAVKFEGVAG